MNILGLQRSSTVDFPGLLSCVVFFGGCDLNCFFCHNRALLRGQGERIGEDALFAFLEKRRGLLDGVVLNPVQPWYLRFVPNGGQWLLLLFAPAVGAAFACLAVDVFRKK